MKEYQESQYGIVLYIVAVIVIGIFIGLVWTGVLP